MIRENPITKFSCRKFIALKHIGQTAGGKIIFYIPGPIKRS